MAKRNLDDSRIAMVVLGMRENGESLTLAEIAWRTAMTEPEARDPIERLNEQRMASEGKLVMELPPAKTYSRDELLALARKRRDAQDALLAVDAEIETAWHAVKPRAASGHTPMATARCRMMRRCGGSGKCCKCTNGNRKRKPNPQLPDPRYGPGCGPGSNGRVKPEEETKHETPEAQ